MTSKFKLWFSLERRYLLASLLTFLIISFLLVQTTSSLAAVKQKLERLDELKDYYYVEKEVSLNGPQSALDWPKLRERLQGLNITYYLRKEVMGVAKVGKSSLRLKLVNFSQVPEVIRHQLVRGRYPEKPGECLITEYLYGNLSLPIPSNLRVSVLLVLDESGRNFLELNYSCRVVGTYVPRDVGVEFLSALVTDEAHFAEALREEGVDPSLLKLNAQTLVIMLSKDYQKLRSVANVPPMKVFAMNYNRTRQIYRELESEFFSLLLASLAIGLVWPPQ